jgi:SAM-dependent methyltransferase
MTSYVFDQTWQKERDRLHSLESLFDGSSRRLLADLGVREGWSCLEVGCGAGGLALWLAERVGGTGRVLATDLDPRFLDGHGRANLDVLAHNVLTDPLEDGTFDLVHARAVLEHLPARKDALARMIAALKPGGRLLLEDVDFGGPTAAMLGRYLSASFPNAADVSERVYRSVAAVFATAGADPSLGTQLPALLVDAGLVDVAAEIHTPIVPGGTEDWTRGTIQQLYERLVSTGPASSADLDLMLAATADPSTYYAPPLMVSAWGRRP